MRNIVLLFSSALILIFVNSCTNFEDGNVKPSSYQIPKYPDLKFYCLSDIHLYDPNLGTAGFAFSRYLAQDRKLLKESMNIMDSAVSEIETNNYDFLIITGDLTKDGELDCHNIVTNFLARLQTNGKKVYVVPGNHDVLNGLAHSFDGSNETAIPHINADDFRSIYTNYGYSEAIYRDTNSLSYVVEPKPGLWLIGFDACRYRENKPGEESITAGKVYPPVLAWLKDILQKSVVNNKAVILMMHHGMLEHFPGQKKYFPEYVVEDNDYLSELLATYHVRTVFTGHFHAQNIAYKKFGGNNYLYDIETGALVTYPCPYRKVTVNANDQTMTIESSFMHHVKGIDGDFTDYSKKFLLKGITGMVRLTLLGYGVPEKDADIYSPQVALAFCAHYCGDTKKPAVDLDTTGTELMSQFIISFRKELVDGLWSDYPPYENNNIKIDLDTGKWTKLE
jgi:3',5'-cyclic AMP phosphodiesterase CpdA